MKLLTLNCHSWQEDNQLRKIEHIAKTIVENDYDVVALQEVSQLQNNNIVCDNIKEDNFGLVLLNEIKKLGKHYNLMWDYSHIGYDIYEEGLAILVKKEIKEKESFFISKGENQEYWKTRKIIRLSIEHNEDLVDIYSCHLGWWNDEEEPFKYQADVLCNKINKDRLSFIMGDFNNSATVRSEGYDYLIENNLIDTFNVASEKDSGITVVGKIAGWDKNNEDLRLDLILANKSVNVKYSKVIFNGENKDIVSDHFGVEVEIE